MRMAGLAAMGIAASLLLLNGWDVSAADGGPAHVMVAQAPDAAPAASAVSPVVLTPAEEALLSEVASTWQDFLDKAANNDPAALDHLAPHLKSAYADPEAFAALAKIKSMQKDFDVLEVHEAYARLATVLTHEGPDTLHYVMFEKWRGRWFITGL